MKMLAELNTMMKSGHDPKIRIIPFIIHVHYSGLNLATARAIVFAGVPGFDAAGNNIPAPIQTPPRGTMQAKKAGKPVRFGTLAHLNSRRH